jgi:uncharacterized protein
MTPLSLTDRAALLGLARAAILHHLGVSAEPPLPEAGSLAEARGAFVTVSVEGALRGCIGTLRPATSLARTVARMAVAAASQDPRFPAIAADEIGRLEIAVSALGPPVRLEDREAVEVGRHGVLVRRGFQRGALLPRIAVERGWSRHELLKQACLKAGLPARAFAEAETEVEVFEAEEFGEEPTA